MGTRPESYLRNKVFNSYLLAGFLSAVAMLIGPLLIRLSPSTSFLSASFTATRSHSAAVLVDEAEPEAQEIVVQVICQ